MTISGELSERGVIRTALTAAGRELEIFLDMMMANASGNAPIC